METLTKETVFAKAEAAFGIVPGVIKELAGRSVPTAYLYTSGISIMEGGVFSPTEINAIELKVSLLNKCVSCIKGHSFLLKNAGLPDDDIKAILDNQSTSMERLNTLLKATEYIYHSGNDVFPEIVLDFFEMEEITETEVVEIIGLIAMKTISNFTNNYMAGVKLFKTKKQSVL